MNVARLLATIALAASAAPAAAGDHPRLFFGAQDVAGLSARAQSSHRIIADGLRAGVAEFHGSNVSSGGVVSWPGRTFDIGDRRDVGNALAVFAFTAQFDAAPATLALARNWLLSAAGFASFDLDGERDLVLAHLVAGTAIAYDLLYPKLSEAERAKVRGTLAREADRLMAAGRSGLWWEASYTQNHNWINHAAVGLAGLALEGEIDAGRTEGWIRYATENAKKIANAISGIEDGTWHEGYPYLSYGLQWHLPFVEALRRSGREDLTDLPLLRGLGTARAYSQIPEAPHTYVLASGDFTSFTGDEGLLGLRYAASRFKDGVAQAAADRWMNGTPRKSYAPEANQQVFEFLFYDPSVPSVDLKELPLDWRGSDLQAAVFRSGWDKGATIFALKSGAMGGRSVWERLAGGDPQIGPLNFSHDHADDNGFYLYANGAWAAPEAQGYFIGHVDSPGPQANQTAFHNSLLVDGQGQLGSGVRPNGDDGQSYGWFSQREGSIAFQASSQHFAFATGRGGKLYAPDLGIQSWDRHALFLDRQYVVLHDVVKSSKPHAYTWLSHFTGNATQEGRWIHGRGEAGQALGVAVVAPQNVSMSFGTRAPVKGEKFVGDGTFGVAEVKSGAAAEVTFLTALVPIPEAAWSSRPRVDPLDAARPEAGLVLVKGGRRAMAAFGGSPTAKTAAGEVELTGLAGVVETLDGAPARALLVSGSSLALGGTPVLQIDGGTAMLEADNLSADEVVLSGEELKVARILAPKASRIRWYGSDVPFSRDGAHVVISLPSTLEGEGAAGSASSELGLGGGAGQGGGGCGSAGPGNLAALAIALLVLALLARVKRHAPAREIPPPAREDDERRRRAAGE